jgi:hypothetical protein
MSLPAEHAAIDELALKLLRQMNGEVDNSEDEQAAAILSQKIAKRYPNGARPEKVRMRDVALRLWRGEGAGTQLPAFSDA